MYNIQRTCNHTAWTIKIKTTSRKLGREVSTIIGKYIKPWSHEKTVAHKFGPRTEWSLSLPDLRRLDIKNSFSFIVAFACLCLSSRSNNEFSVSSSFFWIYNDQSKFKSHTMWEQAKLYAVTCKYSYLSFFKLLTQFCSQK